MSSRVGTFACGTAALTVLALATWAPARVGAMAAIKHVQAYNGAYSFFGTIVLAGLTLKYVVLTSRLGRNGSKMSNLLGFKHPLPCLPAGGFKEIPLAYQCVGWTHHKGDFSVTASFVDGTGRPQDISYVLNFERTQSIRPEEHSALEQIADEIRSLKQEIGMRA